MRCGLHLGVVEQRDGDLFGSPVNRAARIMSAAHGGQVLLSQAVVDQVGERLPPQVSLRDLGGVRLRDLAKTEHVYQLVHPNLRRGFPGVALARGDTQQSPAAGHVIHRARARTRGNQAPARVTRGC